MGRAARWVGFGAAVLSAACGEVVSGGTTTLPADASRAPDAKEEPDAPAVDAPGCAEVCSGTCAPGGCVVTLAPADGETGIAVDGTNVYWSNWADPAVMMVPKAGGTAVTLAIAEGNPCGVAVDDDNVYWVSRADIDGHPATVTRVSLAGGSPTTLVRETSQLDPYALALTATDVYWVDSGNNSLATASKDGGSAVTLAAPGGYGAVSVAIGGGEVYWTVGQPSPNLLSVPIGGGTPTTLAGGGTSVATDVTGVYWTTLDGRTLFASSGSASPVTIASGPRGGLFLAVDGTSVYWTALLEVDGGATPVLLKAPKSGGATTTLIAATDNLWSIVSDPGSVYFRTTREIQKLTPTAPAPNSPLHSAAPPRPLPTPTPPR